jgi:uncharacterized membrane protein HdeD (DUF308 family)
MDSIVHRAEEIGSEYKKDYRRLRWAVGLSGALSIAVGLVILVWPGISLFALTILFGAYMVANGVVGVASASQGMAKNQRGWLIFASILSFVAGVAVLVWPNIGELALLYVIGAYAIAFGVVTAGAAFRLPLDGADKALLLITGLVSILFGVVMFAKPGAGALVVLALIAAFSLVIGVSELVLAIGGKRLLEARLKDVLKAYEPRPANEPKHRKPQPTS